MRKIAFFITFFAATIPTAAVAADWVLVSIADSGSTHLVDRESVREMPNGYKRAWVRINYSEPNSTGITGGRSLSEFDCSERRSRRIQTTYFEGEEIFDTVYRPSQWQYQAPDTTGENVLEYVCFGKLLY